MCDNWRKLLTLLVVNFRTRKRIPINSRLDIPYVPVSECFGTFCTSLMDVLWQWTLECPYLQRIGHWTISRYYCSRCNSELCNCELCNCAVVQLCNCAVVQWCISGGAPGGWIVHQVGAPVCTRGGVWYNCPPGCPQAISHVRPGQPASNSASWLHLAAPCKSAHKVTQLRTLHCPHTALHIR